MRQVFAVLLCAIFLGGMPPGDGLAGQWYVRGGAGIDWSPDADFHDQDCGSKVPAALFGCGTGSDGRALGAYGDFGNLQAFDAAVGLQPQNWLRTDLSLTYRPEIRYEGQANFLRVAGGQPVTGDARELAFMLNLFLEMNELLHLGLERFSPYLGAGAGLSYNQLGEMTYSFPGQVRHKISITPSGYATNIAYMATVGTGVRLSRKVQLDLSYRYSDLGEIRTDSGNMSMDTLPAGIAIGVTSSSSLRTHGFMVGLRYNL